MPIPEPHCDLSTIDLNKVLAGPEEIRRFLPHRDHMEMLTAIVYIDKSRHLVVGYKDVREDEFWVSGHFPGRPLFPGVLMCEAAAQLSAYYTLSQKFSEGRLMALGGIEETRFRRAVRPGERLILVGKGNRVKPRITHFNIQGYVGTELAFHTDVLGVSMGMAEEG